MKKLLFLLFLLPFMAMAQVSTGQEQDFDYGIKNNSSQQILTPDTLVTKGVDGTYGHTSAYRLPVSTATKDTINTKIASNAGLQNAYNFEPEIVTSAIKGSVTLKRGSAADTDTVLAVQNGAGTNTFSVTGAGVLNASNKQNSLATDGTGVKFPTVDAVNSGLVELSDLSNFKESVTVTDDGSYNAFPSVEKASNGDLLTVYRKGVTHLTFDGSIRLKRSTDNGGTWSSESTIITGVGHDYRDPSIARLANGNIIMSYFDRITDSNILIYTSISTDNGITFGTPVQLTGYADYGAVSSRVIQLANGDLLLATYGKSGANGLLNVFKSTNNGTSWSILSTISTDAFVPNFKYSEPSLLLLPNGNIVATVRNNSDVMIARSVSTDSGVTWSSLVNKFSGYSRAGMVYFNGDIIATYRTASGKGALRVSSDEGFSWSNEVEVYGTELGEQDEYSSLVNVKKNIYAYVYSKQNSTSTSSSVKMRYFNAPISLGTIPFIQVEGFNSTGAASIKGSLFVNSILGVGSGSDISVSTNTSNTSTNISLKTGGLDRVTILGNGNVGFGKTVPTQVVDVVGNGAFTGFVSVPLTNTQQVRSNSSSGILKLVGGATNYGGSIDIISPGFGSNPGGINFRTGLIAGESPIVASFNSSGTFNVVSNITATNYTGGATLTGTPTAPTATAGTNTTQIATTAFVQSGFVPQIKITTTTSITTATVGSVTGLGQQGRNVVIDNGSNVINLTVNGTDGFCASYLKHGTGNITFVQGSGRTLVQVDGTAVLSGAVGSTATISSVGTTDYLMISNK